MSKRRSAVKVTKVLPQIDGISEKGMRKINEALIQYVSGLPRYSEIKNNPDDLRLFCSMYRNPPFDVTGIKYFNTMLLSKKAQLSNKGTKLSKDHFIQRSKALIYIFRDLEKNPRMSVETFVDLLVKYCSVVTLTKEEHKLVTIYGRQHPNLTNVKIYKKLGISIPGLAAWCSTNFVVRVTSRNYNYRLN